MDCYNRLTITTSYIISSTQIDIHMHVYIYIPIYIYGGRGLNSGLIYGFVIVIIKLFFVGHVLGCWIVRSL